MDLGISSLQSTLPERMGNREYPKTDMHGILEKRKGTGFPEGIGSMPGGESELEKREWEKNKREEEMREQEVELGEGMRPGWEIT